MRFELDEGERQRFREWDAAHLAAEHGGEEPYAGAIGGRISFIVTDTSLGAILSVECGACRGKPRDVSTHCLTAFDDW